MINVKELSLISGKAAWMVYLVNYMETLKIYVYCSSLLFLVIYVCMYSDEMSVFLFQHSGHILFGR